MTLEQRIADLERKLRALATLAANATEAGEIPSEGFVSMADRLAAVEAEQRESAQHTDDLTRTVTDMQRGMENLGYRLRMIEEAAAAQTPAP